MVPPLIMIDGELYAPPILVASNGGRYQLAGLAIGKPPVIAENVVNDF
jgi:hypothetical protein